MSRRPALAGVGLLLAPGAGSSSSHAALVAIDKAVTAAGGAVRRMDFPYRLAGRRGPDSMPVLLDALVTESRGFSSDAGLAPGRIYIGGRSMGGRVASLAVASGLRAAGLVLVSYPLHPPGKPERLRTEHFGSLSVPCLFISGRKDAFAMPAELEAGLAQAPGPVTLKWLDGDHSLRGRDDQVAEVVVNWLIARRG